MAVRRRYDGPGWFVGMSRLTTAQCSTKKPKRIRHL